MERKNPPATVMPFEVRPVVRTQEKSAERYAKKSVEEDSEGDLGGELDEGVKGEINDLQRYSKSKKGQFHSPKASDFKKASRILNLEESPSHRGVGILNKLRSPQEKTSAQKNKGLIDE